jgi:hypothetical protein
MSKRTQLNRIEVLLNKLEAAVVVRDPGNARSAEQFEGLRKQIGLAAKNHRVHVAHLLSLSDSIQRGASIELVSDRVSDFLSELGVQRLNEVTHVEVFEIVESVDAEIDGFEVIEPAVIEVLESGHINPIRLGKARKLNGPRPPETFEKGETTQSSPVLTPARQEGLNVPVLTVISVLTLLVGFIFGRFVFDGSDSPSPPSVVSTTVASNESTNDSQTTSTTVTSTTDNASSRTTEG